LNRKCEENTKIFKQENKKNLILLLRFYIRLEKVIISSLFQKEKNKPKRNFYFFLFQFFKGGMFFYRGKSAIQVFFGVTALNLLRTNNFLTNFFIRKKGKSLRYLY